MPETVLTSAQVAAREKLSRKMWPCEAQYGDEPLHCKWVLEPDGEARQMITENKVINISCKAYILSQ